MTNEERVDQVLHALNTIKGADTLEGICAGLLKFDLTEAELIELKNSLIANELVTVKQPHSTLTIIEISDKGKIVLSKGGWEAEVQKGRDQKELQDEKNKLELLLLKSNIDANEVQKKLAKLSLRDSKWNKIFAIINLLLGVLNIWLLIKSQSK